MSIRETLKKGERFPGRRPFRLRQSGGGSRLTYSWASICRKFPHPDRTARARWFAHLYLCPSRLGSSARESGAAVRHGSGTPLSGVRFCRGGSKTLFYGLSCHTTINLRKLRGVGNARKGRAQVVTRYGLYRLRKTSCFVSGHDFSRGHKRLKTGRALQVAEKLLFRIRARLSRTIND
jgi:hypothetical protein